MPDPRPIYSEEAEQAVLGSLLISPGDIQTIALDPDDFYIQRNRWIYEAMISLLRRRMTPDIITLQNELDTRGRLADIGGPAYLALLVNASPTSLHLGDYVEIVKDKASRRLILRVANDLAKAAYSQDLPDEVIIQTIEKLTHSIRLVTGAKPLSHYLDLLYEEVNERIKNPGEVFGIHTGLAELDKVTGGMQPGEAFYIGGEPGIGKSILSVQLGMGMAEAGAPGAIYSLEMLGIQVVRRSISALAQIPTNRLKTGQMEVDDINAFERAMDKARDLPVYMSDESYLSTAGLRADLARLVAMHGIKWFVLDYLYLLNDGAGKMDPTARTEILSSRVKLICKEFGLAGITVNSVTKDGSDIRGSGQVKHDADIIVMLGEHIPDDRTANVKKPNMRTLVFKKGREMVQPKKYLHLVKSDEWPAFYDFAPEPNAQRLSNNGHKQIPF
jgi:replicative DNA helicase